MEEIKFNDLDEPINNLNQYSTFEDAKESVFDLFFIKGKSIDEIVQNTSVSYQVVEAVVKHFGGASLEKSFLRQKASLMRVVSGYSNRYIADTLNVPIVYVQTWMKPLTRFPVLKTIGNKKNRLNNSQKDVFAQKSEQMLKAGMSKRETSNSLGMPYTSFCRLLKEKQIVMCRPANILTDDEKSRIMYLFVECKYTITQIAKETRRSISTISRFLSQKGFSPTANKHVSIDKIHTTILDAIQGGADAKEASVISGLSVSQIDEIVKRKTGVSMSERNADRKAIVRLRLTERLSLNEILDHFNGKYASSTINRWIRDCPLTQSEQDLRRNNSNKKIKENLDKSVPVFERPISIVSKLIGDKKLSRKQKGAISEYAIFMRLQAIGLEVFSPTSDQTVFDYIAYNSSSDKFMKIQIKTLRKGGIVPLVCSGPRINGQITHRRYKIGEFDYIIGYDIVKNDAYVFSWNETEDKDSAISVSVEYLERWDKLLK